ncbi:MAG: hypothetical protein RR355_00300 [Oscillospiraceae bacterium]
MIKRKGANVGILFVMLGIGLTIAFIFPARYLVVVLSIILIISGIALCRNC